jgi:adenylosuccinate synthase
MSETLGRVDMVIGLSRGDEAKGRFVEELAREGQYSAVARFNGADNAGHTSSYNGVEINTHQVPMGVLVPGVRNLITKSSYLNPISLQDELRELDEKGIEVTPENLGISDTAHVILPHHILFDRMREMSKNKQGSTAKGISFVAAEKYERIGIRAEDLFDDSDMAEVAVIKGLERANEAMNELGDEVVKELGLKIIDPTEYWFDWYRRAKRIRPFIVDSTEEITSFLRAGEHILAEGAQSFGLDIEHGTYPSVTSSHTTVGGMMNSFGIGANAVGNVYGVAKLLKSSVGAPLTAFPTVITDKEIADRIVGKQGEIDAERGKSTGRLRDVGWFDIPEINRALAVNSGNGTQELFLSKLDNIPRAGKVVRIAVAYEYQGRQVSTSPADSIKKLADCKPVYVDMPTWDDNISDIRRFNDLPRAAQNIIKLIEDHTDVPVSRIGVGPHPGQLIIR